MACCAAAQEAAPPPADPVRSALAALTLEQKAGQLLMAWSLSSSEGQETARDQLRSWLDEVELGGVVLSLGHVDEARAWAVELQRHSRLPLLIAADFEAGVAFRLEGGTDLGSNMLLGAGGSVQLAEEKGRITAREGLALGVHWGFAPVLDVNVNPRNPIINVRSFGESPALVARMGAAFVRGMEGAGMLATAKHYPGHGDVASDSHLVMPTVIGDRARLDAVELPPFRAAIDAGVSAIMTGHLAVPGLGEEPGTPATLSVPILTGHLRGELGFDGIIVTDALDMGGVRKSIPSEEAAVRALAAGADLLLMPTDPVAARAAIVAAVREGRVSPQRLDEAVGRLLAAKQRLGLSLQRAAEVAAPAPAQELAEASDSAAAETDAMVGSDAHRAVAKRIAVRGVTLARDTHGLVPLPSVEGRKVMVTVLDRDDAGAGEGFRDYMRAQLGADLEWHRLHAESEAEAVQAAAAAVAEAELVLGALYVRVRSYSGAIGMPPALGPVTEALGAAGRAVVVSFGNPYLLAELGEVSTYLCAYNGGEHTESAVADLLAGYGPATGRLPVTLPDLAERGTGLTVLPGRDLGEALPTDEGFAADLEQRVRAVLAAGVARGAFPGAVALVARRGQVVVETAVGSESYAADAPPVTVGARFDLASLTKVCATTPATLRLVDRGALQLDQPVHELVESFGGEDKRAVTVRHLLTHSAGLMAHQHFWEEHEGAGAIVEAAAGRPLEAAPGSRERYSDLGLILLMACVERAAGAPFEQVVRDEVLQPLGMQGAVFSHSGQPIDAVPTEACAWRGRVVRGEVHDENAFAMGGVSGHAGLFGTARDVARVGVAFLSGGRGWLSPALTRHATRRAGLVEGSSRALGWDTYVPGGAGGHLLSADAFGHTGFTGTSIWCDPRTDLCLVLLTNRVHPTRDNPQITSVRQAFADTVVEALEP